MRTIIPKNAILVPTHAVRVFKGELIDTYQWPETMYDGSTATFEMLKKPDSVEVLVVHENKLLVQKQEQPHIGSFYSFPGGRHDHEEEDEQAACERELLEETGYSCSSWKLIDARQTFPKIETFLYTYVATGVSGPAPLSLDAGEKIENIWMTLSEVRELIARENFRSLGHTFFGEAREAEELLRLPEYSV